MRGFVQGALVLWAAASGGPAFAHHAMGGETPQTALQGLLSGLAHPVVGPDHLAFVIGIGILSAITRSGWRLPALFLGAGTIGTALHLGGIDLPAGELGVALSVVLMGAVLWLRGRAAPGMAEALAALGGLAHGYALAESIVGAEPSPLGGYLVGLALVQLAISLAVLAAVRWSSDHAPATLRRAVPVAAAATLAIGIAVPFLPG